ncbi:hypothetical protein RBWH47_00125 [Rhodopirellula baltica WH47]|uniref:Uncharacterized protein n=1 Tax=Rhodopirellula baltica WH47 TaxID=991778 RepID=F2B1W2_RHOBT|nr:hypothetical protein RBWH47_00125 [Rhodopirellula baltica WH47]
MISFAKIKIELSWLCSSLRCSGWLLVDVNSNPKRNFSRNHWKSDAGV